MFAFVSAFPKSLHCTDEAQQAEIVLSAVLSIHIYIFENRKKKERDEWREEKMTIAIQPGIKPRTTRFPGRLLFQLSYWARSDSDQITEPPSPSPAETTKDCQ